jgi:hypothetical protein
VIADYGLVHGALTATLTLAYVGGVVILQGLFRVYTGADSQLAVVASTLAIAVLLDHPRRRIQTSIKDGLGRRSPQRGTAR